MAADLGHSLAENDKEDDSDTDPQTYYHHQSGPYSKEDGYYRHRHNSSPRFKKGKKGITHSLSTPNFSLYSRPLNPQENQNKKQISLRDLIKADIQIIEKSNKICPHRYHCFQNAVMKGFFRTFSAAYIFKTLLSFFTKLFVGRFKISKLQSIFLEPDSILFGLFVGLMSFTYKAIVCSLRRYRNIDSIYHKTIAGFISAMWIMIDDKTRRKQIALYCLVRSFADIIQLLVKYNKIPLIKHTDICIFTVSQLFIMHGLCHAPSALDRSYYKWIKNMGNLTEEQCQLTFRSRINNKLVYRLPSEQWHKCYPVFHKDTSCLRHNTIDWFYGIIRAARIYLPVHFLPHILFEPKKVLSKPLEFFKKRSYNLMISSLFLTTYQFNMKASLCTLRNLTKTDELWHGIVGGFFTGLALLIENPARRPELMLYCIPRAIEVGLRLIPNKNNFKYIYDGLRCDLLPILSFQCAMGIWMTIIAIPKGIKTSNSMNMTVLKIIFGSKH